MMGRDVLEKHLLNDGRQPSMLLQMEYQGSQLAAIAQTAQLGSRGSDLLSRRYDRLDEEDRYHHRNQCADDCKFRPISEAIR